VNLPLVPLLDEEAMAAARARQDTLTKPRGSLGRLEDLSVLIAGVQARSLPRVDRKLVVVVAADHGVAARGVSAYPAEVTRQMVLNFLAGGAAVCVLARTVGANLRIVDAGVREPVLHPRLIDARMGPGTRDFTVEPAMSRQISKACFERGIELGSAFDADAICCGEMAIGNTTSASAVIAASLGLTAAAVTGPGTGIDAATLRRKAGLIDEALALHQPDPSDPLDILGKVGGFEIGVLAGIMLSSASRRRVIVIDGLISAAAALLAAGLVPSARPYLFASHLSTEPGHRHALQHLGLTPLLDLQLRLGEGTGALLALPILEAACRTLAEMATFEEAAVSGPGLKTEAHA
jgi:nicotinate-nucleotide--dimethylbenzimidazole phosphoribosyltransferase